MDALDVTHNNRVFPEDIYAASANLAFGYGDYYDAHSGALVGSLPYSTTVETVSANGTDFWMMNPSTNELDHYVIGLPEPSTVVLLGIGTISLLAYAWRRRCV